MHTEIHWEMSDEMMNQADLASETAQQMEQRAEDELIKDIEEMIQDYGNGLLLPDCCIYRVPTTLRHLKEEAYTPKAISIGPFHFGNERLQDMEHHKRIIFKRFTQRAMSSVDDMVRLVKHLEPKVRDSYSETISLTKYELAKLTLLDAGFIIELFLMKPHEVRKDAKLSQPWLYGSIAEDLLLLENQLPFFVIQELFNTAFPPIHQGVRTLFLELTYEYFGYYNHQNLRPNLDDAEKIKHFTDLVRFFYLHENMPEQQYYPTGRSHFLLYNANALDEAGIMLKPTMGKRLLNLKLSGHTLEIPQIFVEDSTETVFRNMIALEQCRYPYAAYITDYALLLDCLVDTHKDVDLLVDKKIVSHYLGDSHNVASLFNGLWKNVVQTTVNSEYLDICKRLNDFCQDPRHRLKATLRRDYCNTPWHSVASIAGISLLVLTVVQTVFSVLQVVLK